MKKCIFIDISGQRFGRLLVLHRAEKPTHIKGQRTFFLCKCDCGKNTIVERNNLIYQRTKSCGCGEIESRIIHGLNDSKVYHAWEEMKRRCTNKNFPDYHNYGGRGIMFCDRWTQFVNFFEDMGHPPTPKHSLDRINNNLGYSSDNCRWATKIEQENNKRTNHRIEYDGEIKTLTQWANVLSIPVSTLDGRLRICKWSIEKAFTTPVRHRSSSKSLSLSAYPRFI